MLNAAFFASKVPELAHDQSDTMHKDALKGGKAYLVVVRNARRYAVVPPGLQCPPAQAFALCMLCKHIKHHHESTRLQTHMKSRNAEYVFWLHNFLPVEGYYSSSKTNLQTRQSTERHVNHVRSISLIADDCLQLACRCHCTCYTLMSEVLMPDCNSQSEKGFVVTGRHT